MPNQGFYGSLPEVVSKDFLFHVAFGNLPGFDLWTKIGFSPTINTTESDVWSAAGVYAFSTSGAKWEVVSSNAGDAGTAIKSGTATGGGLTNLIDTGADFGAATAVAAGDCILLDKSGTTPEWGYVTSVVSNTELQILGGFSSGGIASGRAYDIIDKSASTGVQAVKIETLQSTFLEKSEIVIMNGTNAVDTVATDNYRVNSFRAIAVGSGTKAAGNLTLRIDGGGATRSYITAGFTRARNIMYTVPLNKTLYIFQWSAAWGTTGNANKEYARFFTRANIEPSTRFNTGDLFYPFTEISMQNATTIIHYPSPTKLPAKTDIKVSALATATGAGNVVLRGLMRQGNF